MFVCMYIGVQTVTKRTDAAVQCSLLPGPPLSLLKEVGKPCNDFDLTTKIETADKSDTAVSNSSYVCEDNEENEKIHLPRKDYYLRIHTSHCDVSHSRKNTFWRMPPHLITKCLNCGLDTVTFSTGINGTFLKVHQQR